MSRELRPWTPAQPPARAPPPSWAGVSPHMHEPPSFATPLRAENVQNVERSLSWWGQRLQLLAQMLFNHSSRHRAWWPTSGGRSANRRAREGRLDTLPATRGHFLLPVSITGTTEPHDLARGGDVLYRLRVAWAEVMARPIGAGRRGRCVHIGELKPTGRSWPSASRIACRVGPWTHLPCLRK
jgi:hypothetical protein